MTDTEPKPRKRSESLGCLAMVVLWIVLGLHFFADRIWDEEPPILKWIVIGYGCLVLLGLLGSVLFGKRDEKVIALIFLAVVALGVAFLPPRENRNAAAAVDELVRDLNEKGEWIEAEADALPALPEQPGPAELQLDLNLAADQLREQAEWSKELLTRATEVMAKAPRSKRDQLTQAIHDYRERTKRASDKRDQWLAQVRAKVEALKKKPAEAK